MPAARTDIDEPGVCARIAIQGIRPTARATGLPVTIVHEIAKRHGVKLPEKPMNLVPSLPTARASERRISERASEQPAHAVITDELTRAGSASRLHVARRGEIVLAAAVQRAANDPESALQESPLISAEVKAQQGANVPGFERQAESTQATVVNIALLGVPPEQHPLELIEETIVPGNAQIDAIMDEM